MKFCRSATARGRKQAQGRSLALLKAVAKSLLGGQRSCDVIGRWGGEEFLVILPDIEPTALGDMAERCRVMISQSWITAGNAPIRVIASIGATVLSHGETLEAALRRVDGLMYESRRSGGNQTTAG